MVICTSLPSDNPIKKSPSRDRWACLELCGRWYCLDLRSLLREEERLKGRDLGLTVVNGQVLVDVLGPRVLSPASVCTPQPPPWFDLTSPTSLFFSIAWQGLWLGGCASVPFLEVKWFASSSYYHYPEHLGSRTSQWGRFEGPCSGVRLLKLSLGRQKLLTGFRGNSRFRIDSRQAVGHKPV